MAIINKYTMTTTEVKKTLYKQKPIAVRTNYQGEYVHYVAQLNDNSIIQFEIPNKEATFGNEVPAQLLIRWLINISK